MKILKNGSCKRSFQLDGITEGIRAFLFDSDSTHDSIAYDLEKKNHIVEIGSKRRRLITTLLKNGDFAHIIVPDLSAVLRKVVFRAAFLTIRRILKLHLVEGRGGEGPITHRADLY